METEDLKYIEKSFTRLLHYIEKENFKGYDPYDTLNSEFPFSKFGRTFSILALQFQKRNPLNLRPLLAIHKETNNMGLGILLKSYCLLHRHFTSQNYQAQTGLLFKLLKENISKDYGNACWGYNFDWPTPKKLIPKNSPNAVVTAFACVGIFEYYLLTKNKEAEELILSAAKFVLNDLVETAGESGICFSYTPIEADCCYNSSLLSALVLAMSYHISGDKALLEKISKAVNFVLSRQHQDGRWNYSLDKITGKERQQIDFHQGFILDCLQDIQVLTRQETTGVNEAIKKGADFYFKEQFMTNGRSLWRIPKVFPVDIHNQSQGIITFTKLARLNPEYAPFATTIAKWTINNMQNKEGFFYYRNYPMYKIRISYMRWAQANMFSALTQLLIYNRAHA